METFIATSSCQNYIRLTDAVTNEPVEYVTATIFDGTLDGTFAIYNQNYDPANYINRFKISDGNEGNLNIIPTISRTECTYSIEPNITIMVMPLFVISFLITLLIMIQIFNFKNPWKS